MIVVTVIGTIAAIFTTMAFIPQILKIRRQGGEDLSYFMLLFYLTGVLLWLAYGLIIHAPAVIWANTAASILVAIALIMKAVYPSGKLSQLPDTRISAGLDGGVSLPPLTLQGGRRLRIAVDMDEVIADAFTPHLSIYNWRTGQNVTAEMIAKEGVESAIPAQFRPLFDAIPHQPGFFDNLAMIPGSERALQELSSRFDVFITSSAMEVPSSFAAKFQWLRTRFPFIPPSQIVFCGTKEILDADYLIDDSSRHFEKFGGTGILFTAPHNAREHAGLRVHGWDEVLELLPVKREAEESVASQRLVDAPA